MDLTHSTHPNDGNLAAVALLCALMVAAYLFHLSQIKPGQSTMPPSISRFFRVVKKRRRVCAKHSFELNTGELAVVDSERCDKCYPPQSVPPTPPKGAA